MATLPERPDIDCLRGQARDLQRGVRAGDPAALRRASVPVADNAFRLGDAQRVIAREHGFVSWPRLQSNVRAIAGRTWIPSPPPQDESPAHRFVRAVCETWTGTAPDLDIARAVLATHPEIADDVAAATVLGDVGRVCEHCRSERPDAPCGPFGWSPLMYAAYSRWPVSEADALGVVEELLRAGADPDDGRHFTGHASPFTVLTGLFGGGEHDESPHPCRDVLARRLLRAGAEPTDAQLLYDRMFSDDDHHLRLLFGFGLGSGDGGPWRRRLPDLVPPPDVLLRQQVTWAVLHGMRDRVTLLAEHGVDVVAPLPDGPGPVRADGTAITLAIRGGHPEIAADLRARGAGEPQVDDVDILLGAILAGDGQAARTADQSVLVEARRRHPGFTAWAANRGVAAVVAAVTAGFDVDGLGRSDAPIDQPWQTALHTAVERDDIELVAWLLEHGADTTVRDARFGATPLAWAGHLGRPRCADVLRAAEAVDR
ncbi:MAG: ankyrin repeat domain-containing protein [Williamsia herbipolensis]|nr:ankyrin repeat domain-containing protein [Williamsia herbipolensis]